ncbi:hypothetical protein D6789_01270 [Candidatus Woesearchaeota archaeon]|nr:MAG: hypothetical protein D6789_01270 [Candidatus Woesearchaeota archaeon]
METPFAALVLLTVVASISGFTIIIVSADAGPSFLLTGMVTLPEQELTIACPTVDASDLDMNRDGHVDYYDVVDVMQGRVSCGERCDWNQDGLLTKDDVRELYGAVTSLYDYDGDGVLTRADAKLLGKAIETGPCSEHIYDLTADGTVDEADLTAYTGLLYNHDIPVFPGVTA